MVQLFVAHSFNYDSSKTVDAAHGMTDFEYTNMRGTPYLMRRRIILGPTGLPCTPPPFGALVAVNLSTRGIARDGAPGPTGGIPRAPKLCGAHVDPGRDVFLRPAPGRAPG